MVHRQEEDVVLVVQAQQGCAEQGASCQVEGPRRFLVDQAIHFRVRRGGLKTTEVGDLDADSCRIDDLLTRPSIDRGEG